jgi:IclR family KDG regulon transcriptional repressor
VLLKLSELLSLFSAAAPELSVQEIARHFHWPKSTAYRIANRVVEARFLDRDERTGLYRLGIRLAALGDIARQSTSLQRVVSPALHRLSQTTGETSTLMLLNGSEGVTVDVVESIQPLMVTGILGGKMPLHATAGGKALLAWLPRDQQLALLHAPLRRYNSRTITDLPRLLLELDTARKRGYTIVNGETVDDVVGAAAPIRDHRNIVLGALTIACSRSRAAAKRDLMAVAVMNEAAAVSAALGNHDHHPGPPYRKRSSPRVSPWPTGDNRSARPRRTAGTRLSRAGGQKATGGKGR